MSSLLGLLWIACFLSSTAAQPTPAASSEQQAPPPQNRDPFSTPNSPVPGNFPTGAGSIAGQGSVAGLQLLPNFKESDYLISLQERQRYPDAKDFMLDFLNQEGDVLRGPGGMSLQINLANKPALVRSAGLGQTLFTLQPCGLNQPHSHPRGGMVTYVLSGTVNTGFVEENTGRVIELNVTAGQTMVYPQGLLHWVHNLECEVASYLDTFSGADVGLTSLPASFFRMPVATIAAAMNIDMASAQELHDAKYAPIGLGPAECLARCNITERAGLEETTVPGRVSTTTITVG